MSTPYQIAVARSILSFARADADTQAQLLDSYRSIIREHEEAAYHNRKTDPSQGIDEIMDDPRHGQAGPINRGEF